MGLGRNWSDDYELPDECPECGKEFMDVDAEPKMKTVEKEVGRRVQRMGDDGEIRVEEETDTIKDVEIGDEPMNFIFIHEMKGVVGTDWRGREQEAEYPTEYCEVENEGQFDA